MSKGKCYKCNKNITAVKVATTGVKCTGCTKWTHRLCAEPNLKQHEDIWTCNGCTLSSKSSSHSSSTIPQRLSYVPQHRKSLSGASRSDPQMESLIKDMVEMKAFNGRIMELLTRLDEKIKLVSEYRDEVAVLKSENVRLKAENSSLKNSSRIFETRSADRVNKSAVVSKPLEQSTSIAPSLREERSDHGLNKRSPLKVFQSESPRPIAAIDFSGSIAAMGGSRFKPDAANIRRRCETPCFDDDERESRGSPLPAHHSKNNIKSILCFI